MRLKRHSADHHEADVMAGQRGDDLVGVKRLAQGRSRARAPAAATSAANRFQLLARSRRWAIEDPLCAAS